MFGLLNVCKPAFVWVRGNEASSIDRNIISLLLIHDNFTAGYHLQYLQSTFQKDISLADELCQDGRIRRFQQRRYSKFQWSA